MKIFVAIALVQLLSVSLAFKTPEQVEAILNGQVTSKIFNLLSVPGIARAGGGIKCYDKYLPLITAATENSKTDTAACIERAASKREDELNKVKQERDNLNLQVKNVEDTLTACLNKSDDLEYLKCLKENSVNLQTIINEVGKASTTLADNLSASYKNIDITEDSCIKNVIAKSKSESDELLAALQNCLMNGLEGSDGGDDGSEGGDGGSEGGDGGSDGGEGGSDGGEGGSDGGEGGSDGGEGGSDGGEGGSDGNEGGSDGNEGGSEDENNGSDVNPDDNSPVDNGNADNGAEGDNNGVVPDARKEPEEDIF